MSCVRSGVSVRGDRVTDIHNTRLELDAQVNHAIALLGAEARQCSVEDLAEPAPNTFFSVDPEAKLSGTYATAAEGLIRISYAAQRKPRWCALHLAAGDIDLTGATVLGVICKAQAEAAVTFRVCLRSAAPEGFVDTFLPKAVVAFGQPSVHVDLLRLDTAPTVPKQAEWRELVLFFQPNKADLVLQDLRVFIV